MLRAAVSAVSRGGVAWTTATAAAARTQMRQTRALNTTGAALAVNQRKVEKILVANRGEIAIRIFRTAKRMGIKTVAVYSEADAQTDFVAAADEAVCIGPAASNKSYLVADNVLAAARKTGANAIHPGYGFLSENYKFAQRVEDEGMIFIGPPPSAMHALGDKYESKKLAREAGVHIVPGHVGIVPTADDAVRIAREIGYPVMIKASAGGGGKGMRIAWNDEEAREGFALSSAEGLSSFGDDRLLVEKFIDNPRHIEFQIMGDQHGNVLYLNERECSIQRRNQKVYEEAPSVALDAKLRAKMGEQAASLARRVGYYSAGTVEFLLDSTGDFYFLEMNTRLQVEHPITEYITGLDLVEMMIRVAQGERINMTQSDVKINGHALEARVYAEDPYTGFLPSIGRLNTYMEPHALFEKAKQCRIDTGVSEGSEISIYYDPMISKLITYGRDRTEALAHMATALDGYVIRGVNHNVCFLRDVIEHPRFIKGDLSTKFIPDEYPRGFHGHPLSAKELKQLVVSSALLEAVHRRRALNVTQQMDMGLAAPSGYEFAVGVHGKMYDVAVEESAEQPGSWVAVIRQPVEAMPGAYSEGDYPAPADDSDVNCAVNVTTEYEPGEPVFLGFVEDDRVLTQVISRTPTGFVLQHVGTQYKVDVLTPTEKALVHHMPVKKGLSGAEALVARMPGLLVNVLVQKGQKVAKGQPLAQLEAMKMRNTLVAEADGVVDAVNFTPGTVLAEGDIIMRFAAAKEVTTI